MRPSAESDEPAADISPPPSSPNDAPPSTPHTELPPPPTPGPGFPAVAARGTAEFLRGLRAGGLITAIGAGARAMSQASHNPGMLETAIDGSSPRSSCLHRWPCWPGRTTRT
ncbi:hypothetical protein [Actinomyces ruminis]|uniref:hypothetical protein n=1 Tax=Actinomyces ruminis TaxID=1937003 RepID=UPI00117804AB|nr:hypothetical protein [Actinomyces ruminis]